MKMEKYIAAVLAAMLLTLIIFMFFFISISIVDLTTMKTIGTKSVPCTDKHNRPFETEKCIKTITCSWLGFVGDHKCVKGSNQE